MWYTHGMVTHSGKRLFLFSKATLIVEAIALLSLGLAFTTEYWISTAGSPPPSAIGGALFVFLAVCAGIIAAVMQIVNILRNRIDAGTIIAVVPFLGFAIWGIWYSYTDPHWERNISTYWILLGVILALWLYIITRYIKQRVDK